MAVNESVTFLQRSRTLIESIDNSIKNYGNIKSSEKSNIIKYVAELNEIIGRQNQIIIELNSSSGVNFHSFATQQQNDDCIWESVSPAWAPSQTSTNPESQNIKKLLTTQFVWNRHSGIHDGNKLWPLKDHTIKTTEGSYLILNADPPRKNGEYLSYH